MTTKDKLIHAVTAYDRRQSTKASYNRYALGIYFQRIDEICADIDRGADPRKAIVAGFTGRLADACLKAIGLTVSMREEGMTRGAWYYEPTVKA